MTDLSTRFQAATEDVQKLPRRPDAPTLLELYSLFKQATAGDAAGSRPGLLDMVGRAKFDAWASLKGLSREEAMTRYIDLVDRLKE